MSVQLPPMPESLSAVVDLHRAVRDARLAMEKEVEEVKAFENLLKERLINEIPADSGGIFGLAYKAKITTKETATVSREGWPALGHYIITHGRLDLLQKRISPNVALAIAEETGALPPGIERLIVKDVSITKI